MFSSKTADITLPNNETSSVNFYFNKYHKYILWTLIFTGILLRLFHFFHNRSLFVDELYLNISLIKMNFWELATKQLYYEQKAPLGYLWTVKFFVTLFGKGEKALRLFSLLCSIGSLLFFVPVARHYVKSWGIVLAVGILSLSWPIIYYSTDAKQYSAELLATILALFLYIKYYRTSDLSSLITWGILGGMLLWFSFSAIFVLVGFAVVTCLDTMLKKQWRRFLYYLIPFSIWAVSFLLLYFFFLSEYRQSSWLVYFFEKEYNAFMPLTPTSLSNIVWFIKTPYSMLHDPLGVLLNSADEITIPGIKHIMKLGWIHALFIGLGIVALVRNNKFVFFILFLPIIITFTASGFKFYPVYGRLVLFLTPFAILFMAYGLEMFSNKFVNKLSFSLILFFLLITPVFANSLHYAIKPELMSDANERECLLYINNNFKEGDSVYIFWNMRHAYEYYKDAYKLKYNAVIGGDVKDISKNAEDYVDNVAPDFKKFEGSKRLWFFSDPEHDFDIGDFLGKPEWYHKADFSADQIMIDKFSMLGTKVKTYTSNGKVIVLYNLK